ncbi:hypothetical protein CPC08DRAFT_607909, partial [Agrocybe pediades]
ICRQFEQHFLDETGEAVKLSHMTLLRMARGGKSHAEASADRGWLTRTEQEVAVDFLCEAASRGFPFSHKHTKEIVDEILLRRLGPETFPVGGVGENWTYRFQKRHEDKL